MNARSEDTADGADGFRGPGLLAAMRRHPLIVAAVTIAAGAIGYGVSQVLPTNYHATATLFLANPNEVAVFRTLPSTNAVAQASDAAELMRSDAVLTRASQILHGHPPANKLKKKLTITPSSDAASVTISADGQKAATARDMANAEAQAYTDVASARQGKQAKTSIAVLNTVETQLRTEIDSVQTDLAKLAGQAESNAASITDPTLRARAVQASLSSNPDYQTALSRQSTLSQNIADVRDKITEVRVDSQLLGGDVDQFVPAALPTSPTDNAKRNTAIAAALGLLLGAALAWRRSERSVGPDSRSIASTLGAPLLARLGTFKTLSVKGRPSIADFTDETRPAEDFKAVVATLAPYLARHNLTNLVVASARPGEGRTTVALNLAAAADQLGYDAVLVDEDYSRAELRHLFGEASDAPDGAMDVPYPGGGHLRFLAAASHDGPAIQGIRRAEALERLARRNTASGPLRIFDTGWGLSDPAIGELATAGALLVVVSNESRPEHLETLRARADLAGIPTVGFIINDATGGPRRVRRPSKPNGARRLSDYREPADSLLD
ncbi:MAG: Wzz/FepE/Etk N-terminal domain-containing protein [Actinomycetes bacterium]